MTPEPRYLKIKTGPFNIELLGHDSIESFSEEAGSPLAILECAERYLAYRDTIEIFNEQFIPIVTKITGVAHLIDEKKTAKLRMQALNPKKVDPRYESAVTFFNRAWVKSSKEQQDLLCAEALRVSHLIRISAAPVERTTPIEPMFYKRADSLLEQDLATINDKVSKLLAVVGDFDLRRDEHDRPTRLSLARLYQLFDAAMLANLD